MAGFESMASTSAVLSTLVLAESALRNASAAAPESVLRHATPPRAPGIGEPLSEMEEEVAKEALARGASVAETTRMLASRRGVQRELRLLDDEGILDQPEPEADPAALGTADASALPLAREVRDLERLITVEEYNDLPDHVRAALTATASLNGVRTGLESYREIRHRLWAEGWQYPRQLFRDMRSPVAAKFYGRPIQNGAHHLLVERLSELATAPQDPGWRKPIRDVIGFQPRRIAGKEQLSNHVFGLAIDIDADFNPMIRSADAIEVILRHTDPPINFGQRLLTQGADIVQVYEKLQHASEQIRDWLNVAVPIERDLRGALDEAIKNRKAAEAAARRAKTEDERRAARAALEQAIGEERKRQDALDASMVAFEVGALRKEFDRKGHAVIDQWEKYGILTVPLDVVKRLHQVGFGWGAEWEKSKDTMHFELDPTNLLHAHRRQGTTGLDDLVRLR